MFFTFRFCNLDAKNANRNDFKGAASVESANSANAVNGDTEEDILGAVDQMSLHPQPDDLLALNRFDSVVDTPTQPEGAGKKSGENAVPLSATQPPSCAGGKTKKCPEPQSGMGDESEENDKPPKAKPQTAGIQVGGQASAQESPDSPFQSKAGTDGSSGDCEQKENGGVPNSNDSQESSAPSEREPISGDQVLRRLKTFEQVLPRDAVGRFSQTNRNRTPEESSNNSFQDSNHCPIPSSGGSGSNATPTLVSPGKKEKLACYQAFSSFM